MYVFEKLQGRTGSGNVVTISSGKWGFTGKPSEIITELLGTAGAPS